ncbi:hypothetical protein Efla_004900 [Eimeria flavescens]
MRERQVTRELPLGFKVPHIPETTHDAATLRPGSSGVSTDGLKEAIGCTEGHHARRNKRIGAKWLLAACAIGLLLLCFYCRLALPASLTAGFQPRGLGESDSAGNNDEKEPSLPDMQQLCFEVAHKNPEGLKSGSQPNSPIMVESFLKSLVEEQESSLDESPELKLLGATDWHPVESPPDGPRASPLMIQSFFEDLEKHPASPFEDHSYVEQPVGESAPGLEFGGKRKASDDHIDKDELPGPSRKVQRTGKATLSPSTFSGLPTPTESRFLFSPVVVEAEWMHYGFLSSAAELGVADTASASTAVSSAAAPPAAGSQPTSSQATSGGPTQHPFLRVPPLEAGVQPRAFNAEVLKKPPLERYLVNAMYRLRTLLRQASLNQDDADEIVKASEHLVSIGVWCMASPLHKHRPHLVTEQAGRRFLLFHYLYVASRALQANWQETAWWKELAATIPTSLPAGVGTTRFGVSGWVSWAMTQRLLEAADIYKEGGQPSASQVVELLGVLFCHQGGFGRLRDSVASCWALLISLRGSAPASGVGEAHGYRRLRQAAEETASVLHYVM